MFNNTLRIPADWGGGANWCVKHASAKQTQNKKTKLKTHAKNQIKVRKYFQKKMY